MDFRKCFMPSCQNSSVNSRKISIAVPKNEQTRKSWCLAVGRTNILSSISFGIYCWDDHSNVSTPSYVVHYSSVNGAKDSSECARPSNDSGSDNRLRVARGNPSRRRSKSVDSGRELPTSPTSPSASDETSGGGKAKLASTRRMGKRNIKAQVKRFRMETKAAKTLGIIVGGFVCCWLPFFTMYLVRAFRADAVDPLAFSILFWLGYCNSALNPLIYALFAKDFRHAFKRIIFCTDRKKGLRRGSDGSQLQGRHNRSASYNAHAHSNSLGDESDAGGNR